MYICYGSCIGGRLNFVQEPFVALVSADNRVDRSPCCTGREVMFPTLWCHREVSLSLCVETLCRDTLVFELNSMVKLASKHRILSQNQDIPAHCDDITSMQHYCIMDIMQEWQCRGQGFYIQPAGWWQAETCESRDFPTRTWGLGTLADSACFESHEKLQDLIKFIALVKGRVKGRVN